MNTEYFKKTYLSRFKFLLSIKKKFPYEFITLPFCYASSISSYLWPNLKRDERIDRVRFCQLLVEFGSAEMRKISLPLLYHNVSPIEKKLLLNKFPLVEPTGLVITSKKVDCDEACLGDILGKIPIATIRKHSYSSIFYSELRCPLIHTGWTSQDISTHPMHDNPEETSYVNELIVPPKKQIEEYAAIHNLDFSAARGRLVYTVHRLYLSHVGIVETIRDAIFNVIEHWEHADNWEKPRPSAWWIHGA